MFREIHSQHQWKSNYFEVYIHFKCILFEKLPQIFFLNILLYNASFYVLSISLVFVF